MSTFVDTSGLLAVLDADQPRHADAAVAWQTLLEGDEPLVLTSYVLVEAYALAQRRLGIEAVRALTDDFVPLFLIEWIDEPTHAAAIAALNNLSAADVNAEVVDVLRTDTIPDSVAADGSASTITQAIYLMLQFLTDKAVSGTTVTVRKPDGSTALATFTLDSGTTPSSITRAT